MKGRPSEPSARKPRRKGGKIRLRVMGHGRARVCLARKAWDFLHLLSALKSNEVSHICCVGDERLRTGCTAEMKVRNMLQALSLCLFSMFVCFNVEIKSTICCKLTRFAYFNIELQIHNILQALRFRYLSGEVGNRETLPALLSSAARGLERPTSFRAPWRRHPAGRPPSTPPPRGGVVVLRLFLVVVVVIVVVVVVVVVVVGVGVSPASRRGRDKRGFRRRATSPLHVCHILLYVRTCCHML